MKKIFFSVLSFLVLNGTMVHSAQSLPPPYDTVELLPFDPQGFYNNENQITEHFKNYKPKIVIEVGSWAGVSAIHMASLLPSDGKLYAVDHWLGSIEHQPGQRFYSPILPRLYQLFLSNMIHAQCADKVIPIRMDSATASKYLTKVKADLVYIDASHDFASVYADLKAWYPLVKGHGILSGDDWGYPPICSAVCKFAEEEGLTIHAQSCFWYLTE